MGDLLHPGNARNRGALDFPLTGMVALAENGLFDHQSRSMSRSPLTPLRHESQGRLTGDVPTK